MATQKDISFRNPVWPKNFADPFILKVRGRYYAYATNPEPRPADGTRVFPILTSTDLVQWHELERAMHTLEQPYFNYWAPEVTEYNGHFFLYYAAHTTEFEGSIRVAISDRPEGPFHDTGRTLTSHLVPWAIDPHIFRDQDGQWYLYMTIEYLHEPNGYMGSGNAVVRLADPLTAEGELTRVTAPEHAWQLFEAQRPEKDGHDWYTVEGPAILRHRQHYYEMYSGGCYYRPNYAMSYAVSSTPQGKQGLQDRSWQDWTGPSDQESEAVLVRGDSEHLIGPGHNSIVYGPNNVDLYIAYHAWQPDMIERRACIDRLFWHGKHLWTSAPTYIPQELPQQPRIRELFTEPVLAPAWQALSGNWQVESGAVNQCNQSQERAILKRQESLSTAYLLEVNLRHIAGSGDYGIQLQNADNTYTRITLSADGDLTLRTHGVGTQEPLVTTIATEAWHQLLLACRGSLLEIQYDGRLVLETVLEQQPESFALYTEYCQATFSAITVTDYARDEFLDERYTLKQLGWSVEEGNTSHWHIQDGALKQINAEVGQHIVVRQASLEQFELGATMQLQTTASEGSAAFGLTLWRSSTEQIRYQLMQQERGWVCAIESVGIQPVINCALSLPADFDPLTWHTLRLVQTHEQAELYLDGSHIASTTETTQTIRAGLITHNAAVAFTGVWHTGLNSPQQPD